MADTDYWVTKHEEGWQVKREGGERATAVYATQAEAWDRARDLARGTRGEAYLCGEDGRIRERNTYGEDPESSKG